ncbi:MAG: GNAT family N-acetyltransferase [Streptosporangiaceae bacterium]|jgi:predicted N-acyltransferase
MGGSPRVVVSPGQVTPDLGWPGELASLTDATPYLGPAWLAATEKVMPELRPWHTIATRARGELAIAAGYILDSPAAADHDPRTYLGWQALSGADACCGVPAGQAASAAAGDLDPESFYPALLLGSPLGYRTEVAYNFWTPALMRAMVSALVPAAFQVGVRCILAPWIPDSRGNQALADALADGGHSTFWGYEDFIRLDRGGWDAHLAALPPDKRRRISGDLRRAAEAGVRIERADGTGIRPHLSRIAELTCLNRDKNGTAEDPARIVGMLAALLDSGADVRAYLGFQDGALVASCVTIRKTHRLFVKWPGFDYAAVGDRSGIYFALVLDVLVRDACAEGLRTVEFGAGAHRAKYLCGAQSRTVTTAMVLADPSLREQAAARLDSFGRSRHAAFGDVAEAAPDVPAAVGTGACCAEG